MYTKCLHKEAQNDLFVEANEQNVRAGWNYHLTVAAISHVHPIQWTTFVTNTIGRV